MASEKLIPVNCRRKLPPARENTMKQREKNAKASQLASEIADNNMIFYMDIGQKFLDADGTLSPRHHARLFTSQRQGL